MRRASRLFAIVGIILALVPGSSAAFVQADVVTPISLADSLDDALFQVQAGLLVNDSGKIERGLRQALTDAVAYRELAPAELTSLPDLPGAVEMARAAADAGDQPMLAQYRGMIHGYVLQISYQATLHGIQTGHLNEAQSWLLVRTFSEATRLARPSADSAIALQSLEQGTIDSTAAYEIVRADLLDTYQGEIRSRLDAISASVASGRLLTVSESIGIVQSLWPLVQVEYEAQLGVEAGASLSALIDSLSGLPRTSNVSVIPSIVTQIENFRAAPLSEEEQSGRARQLILYLGLVPVEYKRGVRGGEVVAQIEISEASTFLGGARAAFADLRPSLNKVNPDATTALSNQLIELDRIISAALSNQSIADPNEISTLSGAIEDSFETLVPGAWLKTGGDADFDVVISLLEQMEAAAAAGQYKQAESSRLEAYAIYDSGAEKRLLAFAPKLAQEIEIAFWQGSSGNPGLATLIANEAPISKITAARVSIVRDLSDARQRLGSGSTARGAIIFNSASIVFREGLEAVLILASLMASMTGANKQLKRPLAVGSVLALAASAVLFVLARTVLLSLAQYSERVEAIVSLVAIAVLLLVMNWFFHKVYWTRWIAKHHQRRRVIIGGAAGQILGLVALGFTSVFREGAETVLFLQALVLDAGTTVVIEGTLLGLLATGIVGVLVFAVQAKLPHKKMLIVTGFMISLVLVMMVGKTVHVLQAVGWASIHPIGDAAPPYWMSLWLGIFFTWEGVVTQVVAIAFVFGSYFAAERAHERSLREMVARAPSIGSPTAASSPS